MKTEDLKKFEQELNEEELDNVAGGTSRSGGVMNTTESEFGNIKGEFKKASTCY